MGTARHDRPRRGPPRLVERIDPDLLGDIDARCIALDRIVLQVAACLDSALLRAATDPDRERRNELAVARLSVDELRLELGDLGLSLIALRDVINAEVRA